MSVRADVLERLYHQRESDRNRQSFHDGQKALREEIDALRRAERPEVFPTPEMVEGLLDACEKVKSGYREKSHHGDHVGGNVSVNASEGRIMAHAGAKHALCGEYGYYLWSFTDEEVESILQVLKGRGNMVIKTWWRHNTNGISVLVRMP